MDCFAILPSTPSMDSNCAVGPPCLLLYSARRTSNGSRNIRMAMSAISSGIKLACLCVFIGVALPSKTLDTNSPPMSMSLFGCVLLVKIPAKKVAQC